MIRSNCSLVPRPPPSCASVYYTERKPKNQKLGRPGNEAKATAVKPTAVMRLSYDVMVMSYGGGGVMAHSLVSQLQELESPVVAELLVRHKPLLIVDIQ